MNSLFEVQQRDGQLILFKVAKNIRHFNGQDHISDEVYYMKLEGDEIEKLRNILLAAILHPQEDHTPH